MIYFYNTLGVLGAVLLLILVVDLWRFLSQLGYTYLEYVNEESRRARKWMKDFKDVSWQVVRVSQPPNDKMITLHLRSRDNDEPLITKVSIDKEIERFTKGEVL